MSGPFIPAASLESSEYDEIFRLQQNLAEAKSSGKKEQEIDLLLRIAACATAIEDRALADLHLDLATRVIRKSGKRIERLHEVLGERALLMRRAQKFEKSLALYQEAEEAARKYNGTLEAALWKGKQGNIYRLRDEFDLAKTCYQESLKQFESTGEAGYAGIAEQEGCLGLVEQALGNTDGTLSHYGRAVEFAGKSGDPDAIATWNKNYGNELTRRRVYTRAWASYGSAYEAALKKDDAALLSDVSSTWSTSYAQAHRRDLSITHLQSALQKIREPRLCLSLLMMLLVDLQVLDRRKDLSKTLGAAEAIAKNLGLSSGPFSGARAYLKRNTKRRSKPKRRKASVPQSTVLEVFVAENMFAAEKSGDVNRMKRAADLICDVNSGLQLPSDEEWRRYLSDPQLRYKVIGDTLKALFDADRHEDGLELSQRFKGAGFALLTLKGLQGRKDLSEEAKHFFAVHRELSQKVRLLSQNASDVSVPLPLIESVRATGERLLEAGALLREQDSVLHASLGGTVLPSDIIDALPVTEGVAVCDFFVGDRGTVVHILLRTRSGVTILPAFFATFAWKDCVEAIRLLLENRVNRELSSRQRDALLEIGKILHDRLLCKLTQETYRRGITQFIMIPGPYLNALPLGPTLLCAEKMSIPGVTHGDEQFLGEVYPFEFSPCLQAVAVSQHQKRPKKITKVVSIADPAEDLPGARYTARRVEKTFFNSLRCVTLAGAEATSGAFFEETRDATIILLGTHGSLNFRDPGASFLRLHDRNLSLEEIIQKIHFENSPIVILSACEVAALLPGSDPTLGVIPGALIAAGAASVIASSWPVVDISTGYLVERLIHYLAHPGYRPSAALFRALRDLRKWPLESALQYCDESMRQMEKDGTADRFPVEYMQVDHLRDMLRKMNHPQPFSGPEMWGGFAVYGSGWSAPAGALVGSGPDLVELEVRVTSAKDLVSAGEFDAALAAIENLLLVVQGRQRARVLELKAISIWAEGKRVNRESSKAEALELLKQAAFTARAEEDEQLLRNIRATRQKIEL